MGLLKKPPEGSSLAPGAAVGDLAISPGLLRSLRNEEPLWQTGGGLVRVTDETITVIPLDPSLIEPYVSGTDPLLETPLTIGLSGRDPSERLRSTTKP